MTLQRWLRLAFWVAVTVTFVIATSPHPPKPPGLPNDKVQHILAFATLTAFATAAYARTSALKLLAGFAIFGGLIEFVQMIPALNRDAELLDWIADVAATGAVLLAVGLWRCVRRA